MGHILNAEAKGYELSLKLRKMMGNYFETELEAEAYIDYLLAREVIKEDTKGFKPNWKNQYEDRYYGVWDFNQNHSLWKLETPNTISKSQLFYFKTREDIEESFKKHRKEWKTYLTYNQ